MNSRSSFMALGGVAILAAGLIGPASGSVHGAPQWRPVQAPVPTVRHTRSIPPMQQFRPPIAQRMHTPAVSDVGWSHQPAAPHTAPRYGSRNDMPVAPRYAAQSWHGYAPRAMAPQWARAPRGYPPVMPSGSNPPAWYRHGGYPPPMFTRQFGWQPSVQPWVAEPAAMHPGYRAMGYPGQPMAMPPVRERFAHTGPGGASAFVPPVHGAWRPVARPAANRAYALYPPPRPATVYRPMSPMAPPIARVPSPPPRGLGMPPVQWRPAAVAGAYPVTAPPMRWDFRPSTYGRSQPLEQRVAQRGGRPSNTGSGLPGWATTYPDIDSTIACSWCSGG